MIYLNKRPQSSVGADVSCTPPIMNFNDQDRQCHPERSEGSHPSSRLLLSRAVKNSSSAKNTILTKSMVGLKTIAHNERYVSGIF